MLEDKLEVMEVLQLVINMYETLDQQYVEIARKGNGRVIHDINSARSPVHGYLQLMYVQKAGIETEEKVTFEYLDQMIFQFMRGQEKLKKIYKKLYMVKE